MVGIVAGDGIAITAIISQGLEFALLTQWCYRLIYGLMLLKYQKLCDGGYIRGWEGTFWDRMTNPSG